MASALVDLERREEFEEEGVHYESVTYEGYAPGGVAGQFQGGTRESAVLKYSNYGLNLSAVYYNGHDTNPFPLTYPAAPAVPATGLANNRFYYLGAMYTISGFSVSASYAIGKNPAKSRTTAALPSKDEILGSNAKPLWHV